MRTLINGTMTSIETKEVFIINNKILDNDGLKLTLSRRCLKANSDNEYDGHVTAELRLQKEEDLDILSCHFLVHINMIGHFLFEEKSQDMSLEQIQTTILYEMLPHIRACMASAMASAGLTPYLIPNSLIPELG